MNGDQAPPATTYPRPQEVSAQLGLAGFCFVGAAILGAEAYSAVFSKAWRRSETLTGGKFGVAFVCFVFGLLLVWAAITTRRRFGAPRSYWASLERRWRPRALGIFIFFGLVGVAGGGMSYAGGYHFAAGLLLGVGIPNAAIAAAMLTGGISPAF